MGTGLHILVLSWTWVCVQVLEGLNNFYVCVKSIVSAYIIIVVWPARPTPSSPINLIYYTDFVGNVLISFI